MQAIGRDFAMNWPDIASLEARHRARDMLEKRTTNYGLRQLRSGPGGDAGTDDCYSEKVVSILNIWLERCSIKRLSSPESTFHIYASLFITR